MNTSNDSFFVFDEDFSNICAIIQGAIYIPIFCAGIANNLLTILILSLNRSMRTVTNCYLLNLAISDTLPLIVSLPFEISFLPIKVPGGRFGCQFRALLAETSTNASILTISAFTIERYLAVCRPFRHSSLSTIRRAINVQIIIWIIAVLSSSPYFYFTTTSDSQCVFDRNSQLFVTICFYISATFFFVLPAFILCVLYALMAQRLYNVGLNDDLNDSKSDGMDRSSLSMNLPHVGLVQQHFGQPFRVVRHLSSPSLILPRQSMYRHRDNGYSLSIALHIRSMKKTAFKMLFAVVIAFIICYAPFHVQRLITSRLDVSYLSINQQRTITIFYFVSGIFYYTGSTVNPIFYHLFSRKYRLACSRTMKRIMYCQRHHRNQNLSIRQKSLPANYYYRLPRTRTRAATDTISRPNNRSKARFQIGNNKKVLLRLSLPGFTLERVH